MPSVEDPFMIDTHCALVALKGRRNGYIQLAPRNYTDQFIDLPSTVLEAAKDWATELEKLGAERVLWLTLAEVLFHKHIHLYPRWQDDCLIGIPLFEARDTHPQPDWTTETDARLTQWAKRFEVHLICV